MATRCAVRLGASPVIFFLLSYGGSRAPAFRAVLHTPPALLTSIRVDRKRHSISMWSGVLYMLGITRFLRYRGRAATAVEHALTEFVAFLRSHLLPAIAHPPSPVSSV